MRELLSLPFVALGSCFYWTAELIAGHKYTFRGNEVMEIIKEKATCTECGHERF
jgi:hypothetical protein